MKIAKNTKIGELLEEYPDTAEFLMEKGLHCLGCHVSFLETLEQGFKNHGFSDKDIEKFIKEINKKIN